MCVCVCVRAHTRVHLQWKDVVSRHLAACGCYDWSGLSRDRNCWRREVVPCVPDTEPRIEPVLCPLCHRSFRRPDMKRHKCIAVRLLPLHLLLLGVLPVIAGLLRCQIPDSQPPILLATSSPLAKHPSVSTRGRLSHIGVSAANTGSIVSKI